MADAEVVPFVMWSGLTAILMVVTGLVYKAYQKKYSKEKNHISKWWLKSYNYPNKIFFSL